MSTALHKLMDTVEAAALDTDDDFVADAFALLALAIGKLPAAKREDELRGIEFGALRRAVQLFESRRQLAPNGTGWLQ